MKPVSLNYKIVVMSRKREHNIAKNKSMYGDDVCFCVHKGEVESYVKNGADEKNILAHGVLYPPAHIVNFIIEHCLKNKITYLVLLDDDIKSFDYRVGYKERKYQNKDDILKIIENGVLLLEDSGLDLFQGSTSGGIIRYAQERPYKLGGGILNGFHILRCSSKYLRDDKHLMHSDIGLSLKVLLHSRVAIIENRLWTASPYQVNDGGMQGIRTTQKIETSLNELQETWGDCIRITTNRTGNYSPTINVKRSQK